MSSYFQSPSMHLAMKNPNTEPHNVYFSLIKKCLAAVNKRLLGTVLWLWSTCAGPCAACCPEVVYDYTDILLFWLQSAVLLTNTLLLSIVSSVSLKQRGFKLSLCRVTQASVLCFCVVIPNCLSGCSCIINLFIWGLTLLFSILFLPSQFSCWLFSAAACCALPPCASAGVLHVLWLRYKYKA